jgi:DNA-binding XRE family transcriptional regulator
MPGRRLVLRKPEAKATTATTNGEARGGRVVPYQARIVALRKEQRLSQEKLAQRADLSFTTVRRIEMDPKASPTLITIEKIAKALGVEVRDLL